MSQPLSLFSIVLRRWLPGLLLLQAALAGSVSVLARQACSSEAASSFFSTGVSVKTGVSTVVAVWSLCLQMALLPTPPERLGWPAVCFITLD